MGVANPTHYVVKGSEDIIELSPKRTWNATDGVQTFKRFVGTSDAVAAKFNELSATADSGVDELDEDVNGKSGKLLARVIEDSGGAEGGNTEETNSVWELYSRELLKPIETHRWYDLISATRVREIEKAARDATALDAESPIQETRLYSRYAHGILDFPFFELELRKSLIVSNRSTITLSYAGLCRVVSLATIGPPSALLGSLTSLPMTDGTTGGWEWLKMGPQCTQVARGKYRETLSWRAAERWLVEYGGSWEPLYE